MFVQTRRRKKKGSWKPDNKQSTSTGGPFTPTHTLFFKMTRTLTNTLQDSPTLQPFTEDSHTAPLLLHSFLGGGRWTSRHSHQNCTCKNTVLYTGLSPTTALLLRVGVTGVGSGVGGGRGGRGRGDNCAWLGWSWVCAAAVPSACDLNQDWTRSLTSSLSFRLPWCLQISCLWSFWVPRMMSKGRAMEWKLCSVLLWGQTEPSWAERGLCLTVS